MTWTAETCGERGARSRHARHAIACAPGEKPRPCASSMPSSRNGFRSRRMGPGEARSTPIPLPPQFAPVCVAYHLGENLSILVWVEARLKLLLATLTKHAYSCSSNSIRGSKLLVLDGGHVAWYVEQPQGEFSGTVGNSSSMGIGRCLFQSCSSEGRSRVTWRAVITGLDGHGGVM